MVLICTSGMENGRSYINVSQSLNRWGGKGEKEHLQKHLFETASCWFTMARHRWLHPSVPEEGGCGLTSSSRCVTTRHGPSQATPDTARITEVCLPSSCLLGECGRHRGEATNSRNIRGDRVISDSFVHPTVVFCKHQHHAPTTVLGLGGVARDEPDGGPPSKGRQITNKQTTVSGSGKCNKGNPNRSL